MTTLTNCPNCNSPLYGEYCSSCGQDQKGIDRFFLSLVNEAFEGIFSFNSRTWKTVFALLFRPGYLSNEYFRGRKARYIPPIRLYFITSISFFVLLSVVNFFTPTDEIMINEEVTNEAGIQASDQAPDTIAAGLPGAGEQTEVAAAAVSQTETDDTPLKVNGTFDQSRINLTVPFVGDETEKRIEQKFRTQVAKAIVLATENRQEISSVILELVPPVIFCLLPIFAIMLKLAYITRGFYYSEHIVFAVHTHCFVFLSLTFYTLVDVLFGNFAWVATWAGLLISILLPYYLFRSLRNVYQQGKFFTAVKFMGLGVSYIFLLGAGILFAILVGVMTL